MEANAVDSFPKYLLQKNFLLFLSLTLPFTSARKKVLKLIC